MVCEKSDRKVDHFNLKIRRHTACGGHYFDSSFLVMIFVIWIQMKNCMDEMKRGTFRYILLIITFFSINSSNFFRTFIF